MTKNIIGSDGSGICQSGADHGKRAARAYITESTAVPADTASCNRCGSLAERIPWWDHGGSPELKDSCSFYTKEGSKVKDAF